MTTPSATSDHPHVLVCGTRTFSDFGLMAEKLDRYTAELGALTLVTGEWRSPGYGTPNYVGADLLAEQWAHARRFPVLRFPPPFSEFPNTPKGRTAAFHVRNREMVEFVAGLGEFGSAVAFHDGKSPGTASVIELLRKKRVTLRVVRY